MQENSAILYIICTPIGNLGDITARALKVLSEVDAVACEDTRHSRRIFDHYGITAPEKILAYHDHNEAAAARRILDLLRTGKSVALMSDAGAPGVNDPGFRAIEAATLEGFSVQVVPGPSAVIAALLSSGLPTSSFAFKGFPPRKSGARRRMLEMERQRPDTLIFFESPHRLGSFLADAAAILGDRPAAVCLELTKLHERISRGTLPELAAEYENIKVKGEATVVIGGLTRKEAQQQARAAKNNRSTRKFGKCAGRSPTDPTSGTE